MSAGLDSFIAAGPWPARAVMRLLVALERRPRGALLLARVPAIELLASATVAFGRYDDPVVARALGYDAATVVARGRALRRDEGRA